MTPNETRSMRALAALRMVWASAVKHKRAQSLSGTPSTGTSIAMDGGVTDGAVYDNTS